MKVAIDGGPLNSGHSVRGIGVHTKLLIEHLKNIKNLQVDVVDFKTADLSKYDIVHYQHFNPFFISLPFFKKTKTILTIHDLIYLIYPNHYPPGIKGRLKFLVNKFLVQQVDAIITISETSKKDIVRFLGVSPDKVYVVYLAQKPIFKKISDKKKLDEVKKKYGLPAKFVLYVGDINYNKNIPNLIKTCKLAKLPLVISGKQALDIETSGMGMDDIKGIKDWFRFILNKPHPELAHFKQILKNFDKSRNVMRLGFVPDEDIVALYNLATVYCQPSLYEGFGLPILESFASGTPVAAARTQALVEIGGNACQYFDPKDLKDMTKKISELMANQNLRKDLIGKGNEKVKDFSWDKTAKETYEIYTKIT